MIRTRAPTQILDQYTSKSLGLVGDGVFIGGPLSDAQETAHYDAVQAWATAVGANV